MGDDILLEKDTIVLDGAFMITGTIHTCRKAFPDGITVKTNAIYHKQGTI